MQMSHPHISGAQWQIAHQEEEKCTHVYTAKLRERHMLRFGTGSLPMFINITWRWIRPPSIVLCPMRCTIKSALVNHVTKYSRNRFSLTQLGQVDSKRFLVENPRPAILVPGTDFRELTAEESSKLVPPKCPDTPLSSTGSLSCISLPYQTDQVSSLQANNRGLINVQVSLV